MYDVYADGYLWSNLDWAEAMKRVYIEASEGVRALVVRTSDNVTVLLINHHGKGVEFAE